MHETLEPIAIRYLRHRRRRLRVITHQCMVERRAFAAMLAQATPDVIASSDLDVDEVWAGKV